LISFSTAECTDQIYYDQYNSELNIYMISRINLDGSGEQIFFQNDKSFHRRLPSISHDGKKIAYIRFNINKTRYYICISDVYCLNDNVIFQTDNKIESVNWNSDSTRLVFVQTNNEEITGDNRNGDVYIINIDGTQLINLTNTWDYNKHYAAYSSDDNHICFSQNETEWYAFPQNLYIINSDGSAYTKITNHEAGDENKVWSCHFAGNDKTIIYDKSSIWQVDIDGKNIHQIESLGNDARHPHVKYDQNSIVFTLNHNGYRQIATSNIDGSNIKIITNSQTNKDYPFWAVNEQSIEVGTIRGKIISNADLSGYTCVVKGASISLQDCNSISTSTDNFGGFILSNVPTGKQIIEIKASDYKALTLNMQVYEGENLSGNITIDSYSDIFMPLVENVNIVSYSRVNEGAMKVLDPEWQLIIGGDNDSSIPNVNMIARTYGEGRVVASSEFLGHVDEFDNKIMLKNITDWLNQGNSKRIAFSNSHGEWISRNTCSSLYVPLIEESGYTVRQIDNLINDNLQTIDILIIGIAWKDFTDQEIADVESFVKSGKGLFLIGLGWSWLLYHQDKTMEDFPMAKISAPYKCTWQDGLITDPTDNSNNDKMQPLYHTFYPDVIYKEFKREEREALIQLFLSTSGFKWKNQTNWLGDRGSECTWFGVVCDEFNNIKGLNLNSNNLEGIIPDSIQKLSSLTSLSLHDNNLSGNIPIEIFKLTNLETITLHDNNFSNNVNSLTKQYIQDELNKNIPSKIGIKDAIHALKYSAGINRANKAETSRITIITNLNTRVTKKTEDDVPLFDRWDATDNIEDPAAGTDGKIISPLDYAHSVTVKVNDKLGFSHDITVYFDKDLASEGNNTWEFLVTTNPFEDKLQGYDIQTISGILGAGVIEFTNKGKICEIMAGTGLIPADITNKYIRFCVNFIDQDPANTQYIELNFGAYYTGTSWESDLNATTQLASTNPKTSYIRVITSLNGNAVKKTEDALPLYERWNATNSFYGAKIIAESDYANSTTVKIYDSLGVSHDITVYFDKDPASEGDNTWEFIVTTNPADDKLDGTDIYTRSGLLGAGKIEFTNEGKINSISAGIGLWAADATIGHLSFSVNFFGCDAANTQSIVLNFGAYYNGSVWINESEATHVVR